MNKKIPLVVISGPTGTGKTALAIELCKLLNGEVVSADSMQIYKYMTIGTAKPTKEKMQGIPHHLVDFVLPSESYSVADFVRDAKASIDDIISRGKLPFLVGGTGLYINSLVDNIKFSKEESDEVLRTELLEKAKLDGNQAVWNILNKIDPETASSLHPNNIYRVIRAIEVFKTTGKTMAETQKLSKSEPSPYDAVMIALNYNNRAALYDKINKRVDKMLEDGLLREIEEIINLGFGGTAAQAIGYKEFLPYINSENKSPELLEECTEKLKMETRRYAKRQLTWLRKENRYVYFCKDEMSDEKILSSSLALIKERLIFYKFGSLKWKRKNNTNLSKI